VFDRDGAAEVELVFLHRDVDARTGERVAVGVDDSDVQRRLPEFLDARVGVSAPRGALGPAVVVEDGVGVLAHGEVADGEVRGAVIDHRESAELEGLLREAGPELHVRLVVRPIGLLADLDGEVVPFPGPSRLHRGAIGDEVLAPVGRLAAGVLEPVLEPGLYLGVIRAAPDVCHAQGARRRPRTGRRG